jgi:hypothetical protein
MAKAHQKRTKKSVSLNRSRLLQLERQLLDGSRKSVKLEKESVRLEIDGMRLHLETLAALGRRVLEQIQLEAEMRVRRRFDRRWGKEHVPLKDAAELVGKSVIRVRKLCVETAIQFVRDGNRILVNTDSLYRHFFGQSLAPSQND